MRPIFATIVRAWPFGAGGGAQNAEVHGIELQEPAADRADEMAMREAAGKLVTGSRARGLLSTAALLLGRHLHSALATPAVAVLQANWAACL